VAFSDEIPEEVKHLNTTVPEFKQIDIDRKSWETITDAMQNVVNPIGTAPSAHLNNIDFAGKTGSAQTISNAALAKIGGDRSRFRDNGWFVGVTPRRNPEIVVGVLVEQGEHGYLAARIAAAVIKAYVEKQQKRDVKYAEKFKPGTPENDHAVSEAQAVQITSPSANEPAKKASKRQDIEIGGVWSEPGIDEDRLGAGRFKVKLAPKRVAPVASVMGR
jgi:penicillin-binding protein 2